MKRIAIFTAVLAVALLSGCTTVGQNFATSPAALDAKPMTVLARPIEMGLELTGEGTGVASITKIFGLRVGGDPVKADTEVTGQNSDDPLVRIAAYRAARSSNADAFYVVRTEEESTGIPVLSKTRTVTVYGKSYRLKDLGMMSAERADARASSSAVESPAKPPAFGSISATKKTICGSGPVGVLCTVIFWPIVLVESIL